MSESIELLMPDWPAPPQVKAFMTTRKGGCSGAPWHSLNLAEHVGDDPQAVLDNRAALASSLGTVQGVQWLEQVHGIDCVVAQSDGVVRVADACWSEQPAQVCTVMTADCLPVLFCDSSGRRVAAAHAGWRGLLDGVLENTLSVFEKPSEVMVWFGAAIGPAAFEVGEEVRAQFIQRHAESADAFRASSTEGKWMADIYYLARLRLQRAGVQSFYGGSLCTYQDERRFFSYRREGQTGRMVCCIWLSC
jgi:hypothetical protein